MGIQQIITSDYDGARINDPNTKPTKLTIQRPGQTAKEAETFELYLSESDLEQFIDSLSDPAKTIIPPSRPSVAPPASRGRSGGAAKQQGSEMDEYKSALLDELDLNDPADKKREQAWLESKGWEGNSVAKAKLTPTIKDTGRPDVDKLLEVLTQSRAVINPAVLKIARLHLGEELPA